MDYVRMVDEIRPRFFVFENVKGMLSAKLLDPDGKPTSSLVLDVILSEFERLHYKMIYGVLDAVNYGVPEFRERLIIIGSRDQEDVFLPVPSHCYLHQKKEYRWKTLGETIRDLEDNPGECAAFSEERKKYFAMVPEGGNKAIAEGIDIMVEDDENRVMHAIAVKSGPSVFNADSKKRQEQNFVAGSKLASQAKLSYDAIIGYSYGKRKNTGRGTPKIYRELAEQDFWAELTGDPNFYKKIIGYMGDLPEQYLSQYKESYAKAKNRLLKSFMADFCNEDGCIDWDKLVTTPTQQQSSAIFGKMMVSAAVAVSAVLLALVYHHTGSNPAFLIAVAICGIGVLDYGIFLAYKSKTREKELREEIRKLEDKQNIKK